MILLCNLHCFTLTTLQVFLKFFLHNLIQDYLKNSRIKILDYPSSSPNINPIEGPISGGVVTLKTGRREVPGSNPVRACRPSHSEFSVDFSETGVNTG